MSNIHEQIEDTMLQSIVDIESTIGVTKSSIATIKVLARGTIIDTPAVSISTARGAIRVVNRYHHWEITLPAHELASR